MTGAIPESLIDALQRRQEQGSSGLQKLRATARAQVQSMGFPSLRDEDWKYTSLRPLGDHPCSDPIEAVADLEGDLQGLIAADDIALVLVDGVLSTQYSQLADLPAGLTIRPLVDVVSSDAVSDLVRPNSYDEKHFFAQLNRALLDSGLVIEIADNATVAQTIRIVQITKQSDGISAPRHVIKVGRCAEAKVYETHVNRSGGAALAVAALDVEVAEGGRLLHVREQDGGEEGLQFAAMRAAVARDAFYSTFGFAKGGRLTRNDIWIAMQGEGAEAIMDGLYLVDHHAVIDNHTCVDHRVPRAVSRQLYKGILDGEGRGVFNGKVFVRRDAQQTQAFQTNKNLLRSENAEIDTKPELLIDADDVKCSHGAAIGKLDAAEIFYLQSRGISRARAEAMLAQAYADDVIMRIQDERIRNAVREGAREYFGRSHD